MTPSCRSARHPSSPPHWQSFRTHQPFEVVVQASCLRFQQRTVLMARLATIIIPIGRLPLRGEMQASSPPTPCSCSAPQDLQGRVAPVHLSVWRVQDTSVRRARPIVGGWSHPLRQPHTLVKRLGKACEAGLHHSMHMWHV